MEKRILIIGGFLTLCLLWYDYYKEHKIVNPIPEPVADTVYCSNNKLSVCYIQAYKNAILLDSIIYIVVVDSAIYKNTCELEMCNYDIIDSIKVSSDITEYENIHEKYKLK